MKKPEGYDEAKAAHFDRHLKLVPGAYPVEIVKANAEEEYGTEKLILYFDISDGKYKGYFKEDFERQAEFIKKSKKNKNNQKPKWKGTFKQPTSGRSVAFFKALIQVIENSNADYKFNFDEATLKGKKLGMIFENKIFTTSEGNSIRYISAETPLTLDDLINGRFELSSSVKTTENHEEKPSNNSDDDMFDNNNDDFELPF